MMLQKSNTAAFLIALVANICRSHSFQTAHTKFCTRRKFKHFFLLFPEGISPSTNRRSHFVAARAGKSANEVEEGSKSSPFWRAREDCWRPDVSDVERISWGMPAKKKGTGSRGMPHRLNEDERRSFDQARRKGFLEVYGSAWRSQRRDAPLINSYRNLMDARGRPMVVLHKSNPNSSGGVDVLDRLVVDLSPLRLPEEFLRVELELKEKVMKEMNLEGGLKIDDENDVDENADDEESEGNEPILDLGLSDDSWENRPIYQLPPYSLSWEVSRQEGKQLGKYVGEVFDIPEKKATASKKPKGVKPGKGRRHGGYGIG